MSKAEIRRSIKSLKNGKAPGEDLITAELLKADLEFTTDKVKELIDTIWSLEKVPLGRGDSLLRYQRKGT